jgi:hypothetical protein
MATDTVRRATAQDLDALAHLSIAFHEYYAQGVPDRLVSLGDPSEVDRSGLMANLVALIARDHAALFVAEVEGLQELHQIAGQLLHAIGPLKCAALPMPAQIWHNDAIVRCQGWRHGLVHRAADHQAMDERER